MKSRAISFLETSVRRLVLFSDGSQFNHQFIRDFVSMVLQRKHVQTHILHRFSMRPNRVTFHRVKEFSIISTKFFCSTESNMNAILLWDTWTSWIYNELVISVPLKPESACVFFSLHFYSVWLRDYCRRLSLVVCVIVDRNQFQQVNWRENEIKDENPQGKKFQIAFKCLMLVPSLDLLSIFRRTGEENAKSHKK